MVAAHSFLADRRELEFVLFEHLNLQKLFELPYFADHSTESIKEMLSSAINLCEQYLAPLNKVGDRVGCVHDKETKSVTTPPGTKEAYKQYVENGFLTLSDPAERGGLQAPSMVTALFLELFTAANQAFTMYPGLTRPVGRVVDAFGETWMKNICLPKIYEGKWTGTMCLTESSVGSAVGDLKTSAKRMPDGTYRIKGTKQWISGGDQDISENILHLVLARVEGAPIGIEGISLFLVPKKRFDKETGALLKTNDLYCISLEEKMGIHGNSTCLMSFGDNDDCEGYLIGKENIGIQFMFLMMNEARIGVGMQGLGQASAAFLNAENYAKERIQGVDINVKKDQLTTAPRVAIVNHPDVSRMLLRQRGLVEGMRALCYTTAFMHDQSEHANDAEHKKQCTGFLELLTPVVKAWCSDMGYSSIVTSLQTYGGYGYTKDYPIEQYLRDCKIASVYEGTNGIQALDLVGRKMRMEDGAYFMGWLERFTNFIEANRSDASIGVELGLLEEAIGGLVEAALHMSTVAKEGNRRGAVVNAYPYLMALGHTSACALLLEQALIANSKVNTASNADARFYRNKVRTAKFFAHHILPEAKAYLANVTAKDFSCLEFEF